ncbi:imidazole glycerol phosphate synthase subunit HisH [Fodinisporobacter ferrooxydans]|uniref:Imidazole glycerol phosphate synthase subunit HisH n=1 Tax=Fodinisporobacter ferrooxydans TaxID=2901836 RepID=A0ABY4CPG8_9BACL|nr:imidazole glycerol phosphate synthase subunit HisH [Alicyclobacillaceae bacterium MYW30-H2]
MIAIIDYGVGNLRSVEKAFLNVGYEAVVTNKKEDILQADGVVLPGVGAFGDAMENIRQAGLLEPIRAVVKDGTPFLGICLGMQLLFATSEEHGLHEGLNFIPGHVRRFQGDFKIPQVGWNQLQFKREHPILDGVTEGSHVYFVHSYYVDPQDSAVVLASTDYFQDVPAIVAKDNVIGIQFHPEKSSHIGLRLLANFGKLVTREVVL